ncbi:hypothetical protein ASD15_27495 [Massilia sp. Root351]|jgi:hypothetical protein|uniref:hypothetical protein n=1 Tax=Massilia sp. Root351 TaxID=1736522 RepID=UPI000708E512|nr:hypothetical protein [Massilia sp. Root351]KQV87803.1 hypothetical protein ASD15_27495 [Massilia sp. Root351]
MMAIKKQRALQALGVVFSIIGLLCAYSAFVYFKEDNHGDALIFAGTALSFCVIPYLTYTRKMFTQPMSEVVADAVRNPLPLRLRLVIGLCWLLLVGGFVLKIFWA